ncbi:hypothetical protein DMUE_3697 [Dictyocoela muelleri]|nr:hypothetical protein DMUE_3697 [Dictyocoela muelleri]
MECNVGKIVRIKSSDGKIEEFDNTVWSKYEYLSKYANESLDTDILPIEYDSYALMIVKNDFDINVKISANLFYILIKILTLFKPYKEHRKLIFGKLFDNILKKEKYDDDDKNMKIPEEIFDMENYSTVKDLDIKFWYQFFNDTLEKFDLKLRSVDDFLEVVFNEPEDDFDIDSIVNISKIKFYFSIYHYPLVTNNPDLFNLIMKFFMTAILKNDFIKTKITKIYFDSQKFSLKQFENMNFIFINDISVIENITFYNFDFDIKSAEIDGINIFESFLRKFSLLKKLDLKISKFMKPLALENLLKSSDVQNKLNILELLEYPNFSENICKLIAKLPVLRGLNLGETNLKADFIQKIFANSKFFNTLKFLRMPREF